MMGDIDHIELADCLELLLEIFTEDAALAWLDTPHPRLGTSPILAMSEGRLQAVLKILKQIQAGPLS